MRKGDLEMKAIVLSSFVFAAGLSFGAAPSVSGVHLAKSAGSGYEITYALADGPAVVTLDIETRASAEAEWKSVGSSFGIATGDVSRVVSVENGFIAWFPANGFGDATARRVQIRAKVVAWPLDNPPDYMVVSLAATDPQRCTYYEREDLLPHGGVLSNMMYRTTHLPMRKIIAKDVTWTMGSTNETISFISGSNESIQYAPDGSQDPHSVTLDANYYIAVFETTQAQSELAYGTTTHKWTVEGVMRPSDGEISYNKLRGTTDATLDTPEPTEGSTIGKFRARTGVDFDLPTEAQWEFACRAGHGHGYWPDGTPMVLADYSAATAFKAPQFDAFGRYVHNGGATPSGDSATEYGGSVGPTNATAIAGSFIPNDWGLYDMCGNMTEWCRDWYKADITGLNGALVATREQGGSNSRVIRGGSFRGNGRICRPGARSSTDATHGSTYDWVWGRAGFRLMAPCIAK